MDYGLRSTVNDAVNAVITEQTKKLDALYGSDIETLKKKEKETLILMSVNLKTVLMNSVIGALEGKVTYMNFLWQASTESLPIISFVYIKWKVDDNKKETVINKNSILKKLPEININTNKIPGLQKRKAEKEEAFIRENIDKASRENKSRLIKWCHCVRDNLINNIEKGDSFYG